MPPMNNRENNSDAAAINTITDGILLQYDGGEDHRKVPGIFKRNVAQTHDGKGSSYTSQSVTQAEIIYTTTIYKNLYKMRKRRELTN